MWYYTVHCMYVHTSYIICNWSKLPNSTSSKTISVSHTQYTCLHVHIIFYNKISNIKRLIISTVMSWTYEDNKLVKCPYYIYFYFLLAYKMIYIINNNDIYFHCLISDYHFVNIAVQTCSLVYMYWCSEFMKYCNQIFFN